MTVIILYLAFRRDVTVSYPDMKASSVTSMFHIHIKGQKGDKWNKKGRRRRKRNKDNKENKGWKGKQT
jgi:hypothetical protein